MNVSRQAQDFSAKAGPEEEKMFALEEVQYIDRMITFPAHALAVSVQIIRQ